MSVFTPRFAKLQPNANLSVNSYEAAEIIKAFKNGDIDLAITYIGDSPSPAGRSHVLLEEEYELVVAKGSRFAKNKIVEWSDLRDVPLCLLPPKTRLVSSRRSLPRFGVQRESRIAGAVYRAAAR
jgi:DNA-binding transcriptional LysR family regulator